MWNFSSCNKASLTTLRTLRRYKWQALLYDIKHLQPNPEQRFPILSSKFIQPQLYSSWCTGIHPCLASSVYVPPNVHSALVMHSNAASVAATVLCAVVRVTHDPRAMRMPGSNYQKGFSSSSWQKTLFIFVVNTAISFAEPNTYEPPEVGTCT